MPNYPKKAMIGQWGHRFPHQATPGPAVGFLQEAVRWWDQHKSLAPPDIAELTAFRIEAEACLNGPGAELPIEVFTPG